jgi:pimeloyl-ACP methyl ester carboxylesterase
LETRHKNARPGAAERIDEGLFIPIHGPTNTPTNTVDQWVTLRGDNRTNPVLLFLAPFSRMAPFFAPWEKDFTLAHWDQPGAGATWAKNGESGTGPLTLDRLTRDGLAVVEWVMRRLDVDKVALLAFSGGTMVALKMLRQRPDLFSAYVGSGQAVNWARQEALCYTMILERARAAGDQKAVAELEQIGPPPYPVLASDVIKGKYAGALTPAEQAALAALDPAVMAAVRTPPEGARYVAQGLPAHDIRALALAAYEKLRGEYAAFDARRLGLQFDVPMFFFQGELDVYTATSEVQAYVHEIQAPKKMLAAIPGGGHSAFFMRDKFFALLKRHVRPVAINAAPRGPIGS